MRRALLRAALITSLLLVSTNALALIAAAFTVSNPGFAATTYASGFAANVREFAFDGTTGYAVADDGHLYRVSAGGGPAVDLGSVANGNIPVGIAVSKTAHQLYIARQASDAQADVIEVDKATGAYIRTLVTDDVLPKPSGLAVDPLSGDLFVTSEAMGHIFRISDPESASPTAAAWQYVIFPRRGIMFMPSGGILVTSTNGEVRYVEGTNVSVGRSPNGQSVVNAAGVRGAVAFAGIQIVQGNDWPKFLFTNNTAGKVTKVNLVTSGTKDIILSAGTGDWSLIGYDNCLYTSNANSIIRTTQSNGSCTDLAAAGEDNANLHLTGGSAGVPAGSLQTVTALLTGISNPVGLPLTFTVTGANPQSSVPGVEVGTGSWQLTYAGTNAGTDTITASVATPSAGTVVSDNSVQIVWTTPLDPTLYITPVVTGAHLPTNYQCVTHKADGTPLHPQDAGYIEEPHCGWYTGDPTVAWEIEQTAGILALGGTQSCQPVTLNWASPVTGTPFTCSVTTNAIDVQTGLHVQKSRTVILQVAPIDPTIVPAGKVGLVEYLPGTPTNQDVTVTFTCTAAFDWVNPPTNSSAFYTCDGHQPVGAAYGTDAQNHAWARTTAQQVATAEGQYSLSAAIVEQPGVSPNRSASASFAVFIDKTAPTTAHTVSGVLVGGAYKSLATINLSSADNVGGSGLASVEYWATGALTLPSTVVTAATSQVAIAADGQTTLFFRAKDVATNVEVTKQVTVNVYHPLATTVAVPSVTTTYDGAAHTTTATVADGTGWTSNLTPGLAYVPQAGSPALVGGLPVNAGVYTASASYAGDDFRDPSSGSGTITIGRAPTTVTYGGTTTWQYGSAVTAAQLSATGRFGASPVPGAYAYTIDGNPAVGATPAVGGHTLVVTFTPTDAVNLLPSSASVPITVNAGPSSVIVTNVNVPFDGAAHQAAAVVKDASGATIAGAVVTYVYAPAPGSPALVGGLPVNAGTYNVTATFAGNATSLGSSGTGTVTITKLTPVLTWGPIAAIPLGTALSATQLNATAAGLGGNALPGVFTYTPPAGTQLPAGPGQALGASFAPTDVVNYVSPVAAANTITVIPGATTVEVTGGTFTYDGGPHPATAVVKDAQGQVISGAVLTIAYAGGQPLVAGAPVGVGAYAVTATFAGDSQHQASSGTGSVTIEKAPTTVTAPDVSVVYSGGPQSVAPTVMAGAVAVASPLPTVVYTPRAGSPALVGGKPQDVGVYDAALAFAGDANHLASSGTAKVTITPASPVITVASITVTYDGAGHPVTVVVKDPQGNPIPGAAPAIVYSGGQPLVGGAPVGAGVYAVSVTLPASGNYAAASASATVTINKAPSTTTLNGGTFPYDGAAHPATGVSVTSGAAVIPGAVATVAYAPLAALTGGLPVNAGAYTASATYLGDANYLGSTGTATVTITKLQPVISWPNPADINEGTPLGATQLNASASYNSAVVPGTYAYTPGTGTVLAAGSAQLLSVAFTPTDAVNYLGATATARINVISTGPTALATSFVIWGGEKSTIQASLPVGTHVQFWGSQWAKQVERTDVRYGDYDAHNDFKGFAASYSCSGKTWSTKPGQSSQPSSVPAYITVIVTTATDKDGSDDKGNIAGYALLKVDGGGASTDAPGHKGFGTVVSVTGSSGSQDICRGGSGSSSSAPESTTLTFTSSPSVTLPSCGDDEGDDDRSDRSSRSGDRRARSSTYEGEHGDDDDCARSASVSLTAKLTRTAGGAPLGGQTVTFSVDGKTAAAVTGSVGSATAAFSLAAGTYVATVSYGGASSYGASSASQTVQVRQAS